MRRAPSQEYVGKRAGDGTSDTRDARLWVLTRTSLCPRTDMLQRRNLRSRSVGDSRHAWSGALSRRSVVGYSGGLRMIGIGPEDDDAC